MNDDEMSQALADEIIAYVTTRRDNKEEQFLKAKPSKNKQGVVTNGAIIERMLVVVKNISQEKGAIKDIEKSKKSKEQPPFEFQKNKYQSLIALVDDDVVDQQLFDLKKEYQEFIIANSNEHEAVAWLNRWASKASDISFATHVGKLTHSSSKSSSVLDTTVEKNDRYLTTNQLINVEIDTASSNAASLPIADVLKLSVNGTSVLDCLKREENALFEKITDDADFIDEWCDQLKQSYDSSQKQSYFLSKQIYFPIQDRQYHLLMPLTSSSLVHALHLEHKKYWDEEQENARKQKSNKKYSAIVTCIYPNKASLHVTGSNHSNASSLNGKRGGKIALLPTIPPQWKSHIPSYINRTSIFDKTLAFELKQEINDLRNYLLLIKNKSLSISEPKRNAAVMNKLRAISSQFFNYVETINVNEAIKGWTLSSKLPDEHQLAFEPWRQDEVAKALKIDNAWQKTLSQSYGRWLNQQLSQKGKFKLTSIQAALWGDCFLFDLREMVATQEIVL
ncbi:type I-F CRISPR-associated protein Csy1 [Marinomonas gallaica]|uniref:type I-F CRISPR-associated protein Csy1 n=1 Tax=Marinomonas gallaica TaxID=1806667 RepID=UPI00083045A4|nr:type I-F CRISPR-associated protein Csy1 [Marinomonas gallaica]